MPLLLQWGLRRRERASQAERDAYWKEGLYVSMFFASSFVPRAWDVEDREWLAV